MDIEHRSDISSSLWISVDFFDSNLHKLRETYAGMWIALAGTTVRFSNRDAAELHREIIAKCPNDTLLVEYVSLPGEEPLDWHGLHRPPETDSGRSDCGNPVLNKQ